VPQVDLVSATFVVADPPRVAAAVHDEAFWRELWPGLALTVYQDRGVQGIRWNCSGALVGSCEVWLQQYGDGVIVHCYLRADLPPGQAAAAAGRTVRREVHRRQIQVNKVGFAFKDRLADRSSAGDDLPSSQA